MFTIVTIPKINEETIGNLTEANMTLKAEVEHLNERLSQLNSKVSATHFI